MNSATQQPAGDAVGAGGNARRPNIGGMPSAPTALWLTALVVVTAAVASSWYTIAAARSALFNADFAGAWVNVVAAILALTSVWIVLPVIRAFKRCSEVRKAGARKDITAARVARSAARDQCWR